MFGKLTEEQRLQKAVVAIMAHPRYIALAGVMMIGNRMIVDNHPRIKTAATNGRDEMYAREFVAKLRDSELRFLVLHEVYHKLYKHLITWQWMFKEDPDRANKACDYVINVEIADDNKDDRFATMTGILKIGCYDAKYRGWDSASVFRDLGKSGGGGAGGGAGSGEPLDDHLWDEAQELTADEKQELIRELDEAVRQGVLAASKMGTGGARGFEALLEAQRDWKEELREFMYATCAGSDFSSWSKPNRRYVGMNVYMPSGISESIGEGLIANDMSGSIGDREIQRMLSEVASISETVKPSALHVLYWDTQVCAAERYEQHELDTLMQSTKPAGGGGTDVTCVPAYMEEHKIKPQFAVVFTDGYLGGGWGTWNCPVLWVIVDNKACVPPFGKVVHVTTSDFH